MGFNFTLCYSALPVVPKEYQGLDGPLAWREVLKPLFDIHDDVVNFSHYGYDVKANA